MIIYLPVEISTGEVDYDQLSYIFKEKPNETGPYGLIEGWVYKPFLITPVEN